MENENQTFSSPLSTLNNQNDDFTNNKINRFSFKSIETNSNNYDINTFHNNYHDDKDKISNNYYTNNFKSGYNSNLFVSNSNNYNQNYKSNFAHKLSSSPKKHLELKNESVEMPLNNNFTHEYSFQKEENSKINRDKYDNNNNIEKYKTENNFINDNPQLNKANENYEFKSNAAYEKDNQRYFPNFNNIGDTRCNNTINNFDHKNDYNTSEKLNNNENYQLPLYTESYKFTSKLNSKNNPELNNYKTINSNNETNTYSKKYNSPKHINYADASKPVLEIHNFNNYNYPYNFTNKENQIDKYQKTSTKIKDKLNYIETQKEISLREEEIRLLKLEITRLKKEKDQYFASLEQEKDKNKSYLEEIEKLKVIKEDLSVLTEKYSFLTSEYRDIVANHHKSEEIRKDQENLIFSLQKEIENKNSKKSKKHSRNPSRANTNANNKSEIKNEEELKVYLKTDDNINNYEEENASALSNKPLKTQKSKNSKKNKSKSKIKKNNQDENNIKKINDKSNASNLSSLSSRLDKKTAKNPKKIDDESNLKAKKSVPKTNNNSLTTIKNDTAKNAKKSSVSKLKKKN